LRSNKLRRIFLNAKAVPFAIIIRLLFELPIYKIAKAVGTEKHRRVKNFIQFFAF
jgi:hypothetical protein